MRLEIVPMTIGEARAFVAQHHRRHPAPVSALFAVGAASGEEVRGVATVGRPSARALQDGFTAEVTRVAVDDEWSDAAKLGWIAGLMFRAAESGLRGVSLAQWVIERISGNPVACACSMLYAAAWRAAKALGYRKLVTYTLAEEDGGSLRAAGWRIVAEVRARSWSCPSRPRVDKVPEQDKLRWEVA